jgi:2'-5' RNA ligase
MRLFIGIALSEGAKEALLAVRERLERLSSSKSELRWSAPESWHVTLQFLGQTDDDRARCVVEKLGALRAEPVPVRLEGLGFYERAGVFWAGVALTSELVALQQKVVAATRGCGFVPEDRAYRPHITLARVKGRAGTRALAPLRKLVEKNRMDVRAEFVATEYVLYESFPGPEGSRYEVRESWELGAGSREQDLR